MYSFQRLKEEMLDVKEAVIGRVACDGDMPIMAAFLRPVHEAHLFVDPTWRTPAWRWAGLNTLQQDMIGEAAKRGINRARALIDPVLDKSYSKRLISLGWFRRELKCYEIVP